MQNPRCHRPKFRFVPPILAALLLAMPIRAAEPSVTPEERALLDRVAQRFDTDPDGAIRELSRAMTPESSAALPFALAGMHYRNGNPEAAAAAFADSANRMPTFARAHENLALAHFQLGDYERAAAALSVVVRLPEADAAAAWRMLGACRLQQDAPNAAEGAFRNAMALQPDDIPSRDGLLRCLLLQKRHEEAAALATAALQRNSGAKRYWQALAKTLSAQGHSGDTLVALECLRRLGHADPETLAALTDLYLREGLPDQAAAQLASSGNAVAIPASRRLELAERLLAAGAYDAAEQVIESLDGDAGLGDATRAEVNRFQARLRAVRGDVRGALDAVRELLTARPLDSALLLLGADLARRNGKLEEAAAWYERMQRTQAAPQAKARALVGRAWIEVEKGNLTAGAALLEQSLDLRPDDSVRDSLRRLRALAPER